VIQVFKSFCSYAATLMLFCLSLAVKADDRYWECAKQNLYSERAKVEQTQTLTKVFSQAARKPISEHLVRSVVDDVYIPLVRQFEPRLKKAFDKVYVEAFEEMPEDLLEQLSGDRDVCVWQKLLSPNPQELELPYALRQTLDDKSIPLKEKMHALGKYMVAESGGEFSSEKIAAFADVMTKSLEATAKYMSPVLMDLSAAFQRKMTAFNKPESVKRLMKAIEQ
jgi:hypothetical protein